MITVYITCSGMAEARKIAKHLVEKRLVACANLFPIQSIYRWKGKVNSDREAAMLCKARKSSFARIEKEVKRMHSYDVPCIVAFEWAASSPDYKKWVNENG